MTWLRIAERGEIGMKWGQTWDRPLVAGGWGDLFLTEVERFG